MIDLEKRSNSVNEKTLTVEIEKIHFSFLDRALRKKKIVVIDVRQPTIGVLEQIGAIVKKIKPSPNSNEEILPLLFDRMQDDALAQIEVLACLFECKAFPSASTKKLIRENLLPKEALALIAKLFEFGDLTSILNTTILMKGMGLIKSREIIAPQQKEEEKGEARISGEQ